jgi:Caspase domain
MTPGMPIDNRADLGGKPSVHAILIGVSRYPFLDKGESPVTDTWQMGQLTSMASSAYQMFQWLVRANAQGQLPVPLATCRVLLSPAPSEAAPPGIGLPADLENIKVALTAWREDLKTHRDHVALFYFAGHGVQRSKEDAVLCPEDFRKPPGAALSRALSLANIREGMAPAPEFEEIARTQLYFFDACRVHPEYLKKFKPMNTAEVFEEAFAGEDDRSSPVFFGSISNSPAQAVPERQTLFSRALVECLDGEAGVVLDDEQQANGDPIWGVTVGSLTETLHKDKIPQLNRDFQAAQTFSPSGVQAPAVICRLQKPPRVNFRVSLDPAAASSFARIDLDGPEKFSVSPVAPHPFDRNVPGGIYTVRVLFDPPHPPYQPAQNSWRLKPARFGKTIKVTP